MKLQKLPFIPIHFFYQKSTEEIKKVMIAGGILLLLSACVFLLTYHSPTFWSLDVKEVANSTSTDVEAFDLHHSYRTLSLPFSVYSQQVSFTAGPLNIHFSLLTFFILVQLIMWGLFLTAATMIRSYVAYILFFLFALMIHFSGFSEFLGPEQYWPNKGIEFFIILSFLGLAYSIQQAYLKLTIIQRWLLFSILLALCYTLLYSQAGPLRILEHTSSQFQYLSFLSVIMIIFLAKEPPHLMVMFATNRKLREHRLGLGIILVSYILFLAAVFFVVQEKLAWSIIPNAGIPYLPGYLLVISAIGTVFSSQNLFINVQSLFATRESYSLLLISGPTILLSFLGFMFSTGDIAFISNVERLVAVSLLTVGGGHIIYILANFGPLLREKVLAFFLLARGPKFSIMVAWLIGAGLSVYIEGSESWKTVRMFAHSYAVLIGDTERLKDHPEEAKRAYEIATVNVPTSVKANYNLASLILRNPDQVNLALTYYQQAIQYQDFPYARINAANILYANGQLENALKLLENELDLNELHPHLANNIGLYYLEAEEPDSAIQRFRTALQQRSNIGVIYSNWANVYTQYDRQEAARSFYQTALSLPITHPATLNGAMRFNFLQNGSLTIPDFEDDDPVYLYNRALWELKEDQLRLSMDHLSQIPAEASFADAALLSGWQLLLQDSIAQGISRLTFLAQTNSTVEDRAYFLLGAFYFARGVPEMARKYFLAAGEEGYLAGYLQAAKMAIDMGEAETAFRELSDLRGKEAVIADEVLWAASSKEIAMLLKAYSEGDETYARTDYDLSTLDKDEQIRVALYADSLNNFGTALNHFRDVLAADSNTIAPYLEMGKIYADYGSPMAETVIKDGLAAFPGDTSLTIALADVYIALGQLTKAQDLISSLPLDSIPTRSAQLLAAKWALSQQDTTSALGYLRALYAENELDTEIILALSQIYQQSQQIDKGYDIISQAVELNDANSQLWYAYAPFAASYAMEIDAAFAAQRAIELSTSQSFKQKVRNEYGALLSRYKDDL